MGQQLTFGPFVLDPRQGVLLCGGKPATLTRRGTVLLELLLKAGGEVVTKATLMEEAWPDAIVEEGNLAVQIATLRTCLQSLAPDGRDWITTVPRLGYRLVQPMSTAPAMSAARGPLVAVMPFINLGATDGYFGDGIVEELTTALSRFRSFAVLSRSATAAYQERDDRNGGIARDLGISYVLEGSIRRWGDRVHVFTHLSDAATGVELWADRFEGRLADIFDFEDRITEAVVGVVEPQIRRAEVERARRKRPETLVPTIAISKLCPMPRRTAGSLRSPASSRPSFSILASRRRLPP